MSKKPRRSRHRIPTAALDFKSDPIDERYQAEIDASMAKLQKAYERAQRRLAEAQAKAERVAAREKLQTRIKAAWDEVEQRLAELREIERLMQPGNQASRSHTGRESFRPAHLGTPKRTRSKAFDCPSCGAAGSVGLDPHEAWCPVAEKVSTR